MNKPYFDPNNKKYIMKISNIKKYFKVKKGFEKPKIVQAVDGVSFTIYEGETLGLVGESGCGKSTLGRNILRLQEPTEGEVYYKDNNILEIGQKELRKIRRELQMVYQDPFGSLNPRFTIGQAIGEMYEIHGLAKGEEKARKIKEMIELVGLDTSRVNSYPHEFSGGQRQRVGIARALALNPKFIVADEPVSALDVSVQSQIINLLMRLKEELGLTMLFIAHGLNVVRHISDRVGVMYLGKLVEIAGTDAVFDSPAHPYTAALLSTVPEADPRKKKERIILRGEVPSPSEPPSGCRFRTRCPIATEKCISEIPELHEIREGHEVACHYPLIGDMTLQQAIANKQLI
ncbi:ABC transporter ATP-binding protein [Alkalicoccobacillus porphyridii]|uniref:Dipeptide ABC transporter ATP-binding protein n=1 Tax=Alkalicoccobacillus porphyridii TaxID=2597270 RepID=A0A554A1Z4_9BACI|nr:dipeptide ABC transporter ATP-binding protein [Alkalicoccobacillus porphyridii]TSB47721.1 dipeptide ABC transporter ATP-binding protein [Alkalicoccobacillus porphyridii]